MIRYNTAAILAARQDEALTHGQVMYGLIKPTKDVEQVESTAAMVNVIPKKRIYRMESQDELDLFSVELMKRPLVLQPSAHIGRGFSVINCAFYTKEEKWILLINQVHGKIRSKLEIGIQTAKNKMAAGTPFTLTISMNEYLQRIYMDHLTKSVLNPNFNFVEFSGAEIVIRYPGARGMTALKTNDTSLTFDDLLPTEIKRRGVSEAQSEWRNPALRVVMPDELSQYLPGWGFEQEDPFANLQESDDELEEGATGGIEVPHEREPFMPQGTAPNGGGATETRTATGRVMGRAQRKAANQNKYQVPIELHVPEEGGPQKLEGKRNSWDKPPPHYEDLSRDQYQHEHPYEDRRFQNSGTPNSPRSPKYEDTGGRYNEQHSLQAHSPNYLPSANRYGMPSSPRQPNSQEQDYHRDQYGRGNAGSSRSPSSPQMDTSRSRSTSAPVTPRTPTTPRNVQNQSRMPQTPTSPQYDSSDRYNSDSYSPKPSQQTYLTDDVNDDDDGGFSSRGQRARSRSEQPYNNQNEFKHNRDIEMDVYNKRQYDSKDRYAFPFSPNVAQRTSPHDTREDRPIPSSRGNFPPSNRPVPAQRGLHHYQGSGRSDTTTSDSGFDDFDSSRQTEKYFDQNIGKSPYYNHAFEKDMSPEKDTNINDILAQHKAMAAKMLQQNQSVPNTNRHGDSSGYGYQSDNVYGREIQKWRQNIDKLDQGYDDTSVGFSRTANLANFPDQEQMAESFI